MRYAIIHEGIVENVILWDGGGGWQPKPGRQAVPIIDGEVCETGWSYQADGNPRFFP